MTTRSVYKSNSVVYKAPVKTSVIKPTSSTVTYVKPVSTTEAKVTAIKKPTTRIIAKPISVREASLTPRQVVIYKNNPSYIIHEGCYRPVYHYNPSSFWMWYFIFHNNVTHRNDTIRAHSREELNLKVQNNQQVKN